MLDVLYLLLKSEKSSQSPSELIISNCSELITRVLWVLADASHVADVRRRVQNVFPLLESSLLIKQLLTSIRQRLCSGAEETAEVTAQQQQQQHKRRFVRWEEAALACLFLNTEEENSEKLRHLCADYLDLSRMPTSRSQLPGERGSPANFALQTEEDARTTCLSQQAEREQDLLIGSTLKYVW